MDNTKTEQGLTAEDLLHFKESAVYRAFMATAGLRLGEIREDLTRMDKTKSLEDVRFLQGEKLGIEFWVRFTDTLIKEASHDDK